MSFEDKHLRFLRDATQWVRYVFTLVLVSTVSFWVRWVHWKHKSKPVAVFCVCICNTLEILTRCHSVGELFVYTVPDFECHLSGENEAPPDIGCEDFSAVVEVMIRPFQLTAAAMTK